VVEILGISGSPVKNSNTDRLVKLVQDSTGLKSEFIKLFDCKIEPCHVCMWMTLNGEGFFHARTSRRGINTIFDHFRDKPAREHSFIFDSHSHCRVFSERCENHERHRAQTHLRVDDELPQK